MSQLYRLILNALGIWQHCRSISTSTGPAATMLITLDKTEETRLQLTECVVVLGPRLQVTATVCFVICQDKTNLY